jgi:hypothetical protein
MAYEVPIVNPNLGQQALLPSDLMERGFDFGRKQLTAQREDQAFQQQQDQQNALKEAFQQSDTSTPEGQQDLIRKVGKINPQMAMNLSSEFGKQAQSQALIGKEKAQTAEAEAKTAETKQKTALDLAAQEKEDMTGFLGDANQALSNISQIIPDKTILPGTTTYKERMDRANKMVDEWSSEMKLKYHDPKIQGVIQKIDDHDWQTPDEFRNHLGLFQKLQQGAKQQQPQVPSGYQPSSTGTGLSPIPGGPADPAQVKRIHEAERESIPEAAQRAEEIAKKRQEAKATLSLQGGRESVFNQRVMNAGNEAVAALKNIVQLPITVSTGIAGYGRHRTGILDAPKEALAARLTPQDDQLYKIMTGGLQRSLAAIEASGLANVGALSQQMDASIINNPADTQIAKLSKLAEARQIIDKGMETLSTNPRLSKEQMGLVVQLRKDVADAIPWTQQDVIDLINSDNPKASMKDVMGGKQKKAEKKEGGVLKYNPATGAFD